MAASETVIANMALSHLGVGKQIASLTESSEEARACNLFYEPTRDELLRSAPWPFAKKQDSLAVVETDPTDEWGYSYTYPTDCLMIRRLCSGTRNDSRQTRVPYQLYYSESSTLIYCDLAEADFIIEYTVRVENTSRFQPDFDMALSYLLASRISPRLSKGDPFKVGDRALKLYGMAYSIASANAFNEEQAEEDVVSEFERSR